MGGVATFVDRKYKDNFVKISEGEHNDEYLVTRHSNFKYPLNIINVYGEQEMRYSRTDVQDRWGRILNEVKKIEQRNELALIIGDLNKHIGNDATGVKDNHSKVTFGGELVRGLIASGDFICMNNSPKAFGGPFTRYDPSCPLKTENMSCLDLVLASSKLEQFIEKIEIDRDMKFSPIRPISKTKSVSSDHFPVIVTFCSEFCEEKQTWKKPDKFTMWNTHKQDGWTQYKELTDEDDAFKNVFVNNTHENMKTTTEVVEKIDKIMTKVKFTAFGKVKRKQTNNQKEYNAILKDENCSHEEMNQKLLDLQRKDAEEKLTRVAEIKKSKGKTSAIFDTLNSIRGKKKAGPEMVAMKHPES